MSTRTFTRTIYSGKKSFCKSTISINILLIQHCPIQVMEVIAYDPILKCEAPHLFLNENVLLWQLDSDLIASSRADMQELERAKVEYILDQIVVASYLPDSAKFELGMKRSSLDGHSEIDGLMVVKPRGLVAYASPFNR